MKNFESRKMGVEKIFQQSKSGVGSRKFFLTVEVGSRSRQFLSVEVGSRPTPDSKMSTSISTPRSLASLEIKDNLT